MIRKRDIFVERSHWENFSEDELNKFAKKIFNYYKETGFPYYPTNSEFRNDSFNLFMNYKHKLLFNGTTIGQSMHGVGLMWSYFPHMFEVRVGNKKTPMDIFNNDDLFMNCIHKKLLIGSRISNSGLRKLLTTHKEANVIKGFKPTTAAAIYDYYAPNGIVWDMCGGWGGKMLGAIKSSVKKYIVTELNSLNFNGLENLNNDYNRNTDINIIMSGCENYVPKKESLNLCFTKIPYFDLEDYLDEPTQAHVIYPNIDIWIEKFLKETYISCFYGLKKNGHMIINIYDSKNYNLNLEEISYNIAIDIGFTYESKLKLLGRKIEPIYVFKK